MGGGCKGSNGPPTAFTRPSAAETSVKAGPRTPFPVAVAKRLWAGLLLLAGCAGDDDGTRDLERLELEQLDCRPVCDLQCVDAWNVRACCHVPPECAQQQPEPELEPEPPSP